MFMTPKNGLKVGLVISFALTLVILLGIVIVGLSSYDGYCISFEPPARPCDILEYIFPYLVLRVFFSIVIWPIKSSFIYIIILSPPIIGYLLGKRNSIPELVE